MKIPLDSQLVREAAKKVLFLVVRPLRGGGVVRDRPLRKKELFFLFVAVEKLNIFCLRRHVEILILVYTV